MSCLHWRNPLFSFPFPIFPCCSLLSSPYGYYTATSQFNCFQAISFPTLMSLATHPGLGKGKPQGTGLVMATLLLCCHSPLDDFPVHFLIKDRVLRQQESYTLHFMDGKPQPIMPRERKMVFFFSRLIFPCYFSCLLLFFTFFITELVHPTPALDWADPSCSKSRWITQLKR